MDIFYLKTCLLSIKAANWGTGSLQLFYSRFTTKHLLSFWTTWDSGPIVNSPTWSSVSWSSIKLTQRKFSLINPQSDLWAITTQISQARSCRIFLASNDGTLSGARKRSTRDHPRPQGHGESLPHPPRAPTAPLRGQCGQPLLVQT